MAREERPYERAGFSTAAEYEAEVRLRTLVQQMLANGLIEPTDSKPILWSAKPPSGRKTNSLS